MSFRGASRLYLLMDFCLTIGTKPPSHYSGMLWVKKVGYYCLKKEKVKADDWILIVDESIGIGQEKLLVVLGVRESEVDFSRPLRMQDMEPIIIKSRKKWTGELIAEELEAAKALVGQVKYASTDGSCVLKKALRLSGVEHVYDVTHATAIMLEKLYRDDERFKELTHLMGQMRLRLCCSEHAHIIPPNQRSKSRFLNVDLMTSWGMRVFNAMDSGRLSAQETDLLQWLADRRPFVEEMGTIIRTAEGVCRILKNNGMSKATKKECFKLLRKLGNTGKQKLFRGLFECYLTTNCMKITERGQKLMCCSDVIESTFGKYKNELSKNPMNGVTDLALIIPTFTSNLDEAEIMKAIDFSTCKMLRDWRKENLCESLLSKRKTVFKTNGVKK